MIDYYKSQWHNCNNCRIHYMSEAPHLKAYLCDECWNKIPHFIVGKKPKKIEKPKGYSVGQILLYTVGNILCLVVIGYYLWFK